ncbi:DNA mismatch repair endonuclease MutL [Aquifex aeolicus]|uniref:DNA mismatch repair protein MutL n=1 Tax=Aquifex aeolicus (strain VF5) TaxID=224324 RepID=MUTL_AQUAE|nr:DNA mismatch repair endonuclease MutL [Aquifex aeolicus]O67518.1 RecName: Full=DNA mismatch repair protein MutL [Aquifex aeolicus VF5]AAC07483.1 DNA mismatch repair protein MutL [Aquifex aeolicus VF5]
MFVKLLPPEVRKVIAAGEVIESPVDVVKELVENSLDAKATKVEVEIVKGGKRLIRVKDNGTGIHPEDVEKVVLQGATSKIETEKDLMNISTYGFRGEALYSISSVSKFKLRSRFFQEKEGKEIEVEAGNILGTRRVGMPVGTEVEVRDLFFNLPVRRKFLKKEDTERRKVLELIKEYALTNPEVEFTLFSEGRETLKLKKSSLKERVEEVFQTKTEELYAEREGITLRAFVSRNQRQGKYYVFINKRPIQNKNLKEFLRKVFGYKTLVVLYAELPPFMVDFNVHPKKKEVNILKERKFLELVRELAGKEKPIVDIPLSQPVKTYKPTYEILGQMDETFILVKDSEYLYFVDQHLLEERINYEKLKDENLACRISVKAGQKLSEEKIRELIKTWRNLENPHVCPHGRPIYYKIPLREIYEKVGRNY